MQEIRVYTTVVCAYCAAAKRLLAQRGLPYLEIDLTSDQELRMKLSRENGGYRTVPMIFIGDRFIGGFDDLNALDKKGELMAIVNA
jgi:glutaredoxin 3